MRKLLFIRLVSVLKRNEVFEGKTSFLIVQMCSLYPFCPLVDNVRQNTFTIVTSEMLALTIGAPHELIETLELKQLNVI